MPSLDATLLAPAVPRVRFEVRNAMVMELLWALYLTPDESAAEFPDRAGRFAGSPELEARIPAFWEDGEPCFTELLVAAERGGVLFEDDPERLWAGLAAGVTAPLRAEPLASESPEDRIRFLARLDHLHDDAVLRAGWLELLRDTWAAVEDRWQDEGRNVAESLVWEVRSRVPEVGTYADLTPLLEDGCDFGGLLPRLVADSEAASQQVVLVPAWLCRKGFLISLVHWLVWGPPNPTRPRGPSAETRARARRHKALGDPTRLAIFEAAARRPRSVGELARELGVAQPTVSNHVRILRAADLLTAEKEGGRRLVADVAAFERFLDESRRAVVR